MTTAVPLVEVLRVAYATAGQGTDVAAGEKMPDLFVHLADAVHRYLLGLNGLPSCGFNPEAHAAAYNEGFQEAVAQGLADDPSLAGDWLAERDRAVREEATAAALALLAEHRRVLMSRRCLCLACDMGRALEGAA